MKILITGANGLLGQHLIHELVRLGYTVSGVAKGSCRLENIQPGSYRYIEGDITDGVRLREIITGELPKLVVHAAAMTQVDQCEDDKQLCYNTNVSATRFLIDAIKEVNAKLLYISTDFIFDGHSGPYSEDDTAAPVNYYGSTKLAAEKAVMESDLEWTIVRTVLVFGQTVPGTRSNIITWVRQNLEEGKTIKVVSDQWRTPTFVQDLVRGIELIIKKGNQGIFHIAGKDTLTPYDMAIKTAKFFQLPLELIEKVDTVSFPQSGQRPLKTGFVIDKARKELGYDPISFDEALKEMFDKQV